LALIVRSLGLQGIMSNNLNMQYRYVLTAIWVELMADSAVLPVPHPSRGHELFTLASLFVGVLSVRLMLGKIGCRQHWGLVQGLR
ncbi:hypothetical protein B0H11DRAFT_1671905, partial [Mycena galericulata]